MSKKPTLTRAIRLRLNSPVGQDWADVGPELHSLKPIMHRIFQAAVLATVTAAEAGVSRGKRTPYRHQAVKRELDQIAKFTKNERTRRWADDGGIAGVVIDQVKQLAGKQADNYLAKRFKEPMRIPSAKYPAPIYVRNTGWRVSRDQRDGLVLEIKLRGGRSDWMKFRCAPIKGQHWTILRDMVAGHGGHKQGDLKLVYEKRKDRKTGKKRGWEAIVSVTSPAPEVSGVEALAVHRGKHNFIYAVCTDGFAKVLRTGESLRVAKERLSARHQSLSRSVRELGPGAYGRGRKRRLKAKLSLGDKEKRFVRTYCQQTAAAVVKLAVQRGCYMVLIEDYGGIEPDEDTARYVTRFPFFQLAEAIRWAAKKEGLIVESVPSEYISTTCHRCGASSERFHNQRTGTFHCGECRFERPADFVAALHMLKRADADVSVWNKRFETLDKLAPFKGYIVREPGQARALRVTENQGSEDERNQA